MEKNKGRKESGRILDKAAFGFDQPLSLILLAFSSGGAGAPQGCWDGLDKDFQIEPQRPLINIVHRGGRS